MKRSSPSIEADDAVVAVADDAVVAVAESRTPFLYPPSVHANHYYPVRENMTVQTAGNARMAYIWETVRFYTLPALKTLADTSAELIVLLRHLAGDFAPATGRLSVYDNGVDNYDLEEQQSALRDAMVAKAKQWASEFKSIDDSAALSARLARLVDTLVATLRDPASLVESQFAVCAAEPAHDNCTYVCVCTKNCPALADANVTEKRPAAMAIIDDLLALKAATTPHWQDRLAAIAWLDVFHHFAFCIHRDLSLRKVPREDLKRGDTVQYKLWKQEKVETGVIERAWLCQESYCVRNTETNAVVDLSERSILAKV